MNLGMLWFDNDPKSTLLSKVARAAEYYHQKYGYFPNFCLVHPSMLSDSLLKTDLITVKPNRSIQPGHLWIGVEDKQ